LLFFGSERVWTETASEHPTGHTGLTSKAEEKGFNNLIVAQVVPLGPLENVQGG